jgi:MoaA/NifB/PqqE/SkfB family radical SAM enzyme
MDQKLYADILDMLKKAGTVRLLSPMLQSEPLLDPFIIDRIKLAKKVLGWETMVSIVTNGSLLTPKVAHSLVEAEIDRIEISIDAMDEGTYQKLRPGLSFSRIMENTKKLLFNYSDIDVVVRFLYHKENRGQERIFKRYWRRKGADILFTPIVNRAGFVDEFDKMRRTKYGPWKYFKKYLWRLLVRFVSGADEPSKCVLPFSWMYILVDGKAVLCCHDWGPIDIVGNLQTQTLEEVWNGDKLNMYRHLLWTNMYSKSHVCRNCSVINGVN